MDESLSARQTQLLKALIDEYIDTAEPVGSQVLEKKHDLGISSATIRNEMVELTRKGFLKQPHTSAGRVPTPRSMKFYISQLMEEKQMSVAEEVKAKEEVWDVRKDIDKLMEEATSALAERTNSLAVSVLDDGRSWHFGLSHVFSFPEFADIAMCTNIFEFLEERNRLMELFFQRIKGMSPIEVLFGEDIGWPEFEPMGVVATRFRLKDNQGALGVIGPSRNQYASLIPVIRYFGGLIEEVAGQ